MFCSTKWISCSLLYSKEGRQDFQPMNSGLKDVCILVTWVSATIDGARIVMYACIYVDNKGVRNFPRPAAAETTRANHCNAKLRASANTFSIYVKVLHVVWKSFPIRVSRLKGHCILMFSCITTMLCTQAALGEVPAWTLGDRGPWVRGWVTPSSPAQARASAIPDTQLQ